MYRLQVPVVAPAAGGVTPTGVTPTAVPTCVRTCPCPLACRCHGLLGMWRALQLCCACWWLQGMNGTVGAWKLVNMVQRARQAGLSKSGAQPQLSKLYRRPITNTMTNITVRLQLVCLIARPPQAGLWQQRWSLQSTSCSPTPAASWQAAESFWQL